MRALIAVWPEVAAGLAAGRPDVPVLFVHGEDDPVVPIADARANVAQLPRARLAAFPGDLHDVLNEHDRDVVHETVAAFVTAPWTWRQPTDRAALLPTLSRHPHIHCTEDTMSTTLDGPQPVTTSPTAEEFAQRLLDAILGAQFVQAAYLGDRLGYYQALAAAGPLTSPELAARTGTAERYAREWLEHQAVSGVLTVDDSDAAPDERRFELPAGPAEALTDPTSPAHVLPMAGMVCGLGRHLDSLLGAYRSGGG